MSSSNLPSTASASASAISLNVLPARTGIAWVKLGIKTFFKQPLALAGLFLLNFALLQLLNFLPAIGFVLAFGLIPAFNAGMFVAVKLAAENQLPKPTTLFIAFKKNVQSTKSILLLGAFYLIAFTVLITIFNLIYVDPTNAPLILEGKLNEKVFGNSDFQTASLLILVLQIPVGMLFWHAPALVHWHDVPPLKALFFSWMACFRNFPAMVVYIFGWVSVFTFGGLILTVLAVVTDSITVVSYITPPAALLIAAMFFTSIYFTFKDSFSVKNNDADSVFIA
jgi:hypothetical protein